MSESYIITCTEPYSYTVYSMHAVVLNALLTFWQQAYIYIHAPATFHPFLHAIIPISYSMVCSYNIHPLQCNYTYIAT